MRWNRERETEMRRHKAANRNKRICMHRADNTQHMGSSSYPKSYEFGKGSVCLDVERQSWGSQSYEFGDADEPDVYVHRDMAATISARADNALRGSVRIPPMPCTYIHAYTSMLMHTYTRVYPQYVGSRPTQFCYSDRCV